MLTYPLLYPIKTQTKFKFKLLSLLTFTVTNSLLSLCYTQKGDRSDSKKEKEESVQNPSQPHPQPLSEWRGEWRVPLTTEQITRPPAHSWTCQLTPTTHLLANSFTHRLDQQLIYLPTRELVNSWTCRLDQQLIHL